MVPAHLMPLPLMATLLLLAQGVGEPLPDPTRPADFFSRSAIQEAQPQELINWHLTAIRISTTHRSAIVNGKLVKVGDEIGSATVLEITSKSVVLDTDRKRLEINLIPRGIKKKLSKIK